MPFTVTDARLADLRAPGVQRALCLDGSESGTLWQPERAKGQPETSWRASNAARTFGADGMIYAARSDSQRWHIVLFRWNEATAPQVRQDGLPIAV